MKSVFSWFITAIVIMFWIFRVVITMMATFNVDFTVSPINYNTEIVILFLTIPCILLIIKRNLIGAIFYFVMYGWYFGFELANILTTIFTTSEITISMDIAIRFIVCAMAVFIALLVLMDIIISRFTSTDTRNRKIDWFYKNEKFDRKNDERADKNNYRIY